MAQDPRDFITEHQKQAKSFETFADVIGIDPEQTYVGGTFKDEIHNIHTIHADSTIMTGLMDVTNKYAGGSRFHLTQMGAYSFVVQLMLGYLCYKYGVGKEGLGMSTLKEFTIRWKKMVRRSTDINAMIEERHCSINKNRYTSEFGFEIGDGAAFGHLIGMYRIHQKKDESS